MFVEEDERDRQLGQSEELKESDFADPVPPDQMTPMQVMVNAIKDVKE
jgi:hypothetical protein